VALLRTHKIIWYMR